MDLENVWTVAMKDFSALRMKKNIVPTFVAFPLGMALGLPALVWLVEVRQAISFVTLFPLFNAFAFLFIIVASSLPTGIAFYSIVGEKVEKSLEPLLATPATDGEILLGKSLDSAASRVLSRTRQDKKKKGKTVLRGEDLRNYCSSFSISFVS